MKEIIHFNLKIFVILSTTFILNGCYYQQVSNYDLKMGGVFCEDKGGIDYLQSWWIGTVKIHCENGDLMRVSDYAEILAKKEIESE